MFKTVVRKLWLIIGALVVIFITAVYLINIRHNSQLVKLSEGETIRTSNTLANIISLHTKSLVSFVYDYTYWDEMVNFTKNPSKKWAEVNIDAVLPQFKTHCAWVFDTSFNYLYSHNVFNEKKFAKLKLNTSILKDIFMKNKFPHFYLWLDNIIAEISGAPIQYSDDLERTGKPNGFYLVARLYTNEFINNLSETNVSGISILSIEDYNKLNNKFKSKKPEDIYVFIPLHDYKSEIIGYVYSYHESAGIKFMKISYRQQILNIIFWGITTLLVLSTALIILVIKPINIISSSLREENLLNLKILSKSKTEFGRFANLLLDFFEQKKQLEYEINTRKKTEAELIKLSSVVKQNPLGIIIIDINGTIEYVNPRFCEITGFTADYLIGRSSKIIEKEYFNKNFFAGIIKTLKNNNVWNGDLLLRKKTGEQFWCSILIFALKEKDNLQYYIGIIEDITEKKKIFEELVEAKQRAEEINKIKSQFFAYMSHELRTPFMGLMGYADLIKETTNDNNIKEMAEGILRSSKRMLETLTNILTITKLEFDQTEVYKKPFIIEKILEEVYKNYYSTAEMKNIKLIKSFNVNQLIINTDERILYGILSNLLNNAIKFTNEGYIEIGARVENNELILNVKDTGIGIPQDKLSIIFQEFRQVSEGYTREYQGTGLGLAIVYKYLKLLGGSIRVESELGKGSNFIISIPLNSNNS